MSNPDPGGHFASDEHRRVMANLPNPDEDPVGVDTLLAERVAKDEHLFLTEAKAKEVLLDLQADGHAKELKDGWKNTPEGFELLTGPNKES